MMSKLCLFGRNKQEKYVVCQNCLKEDCMVGYIIRTVNDEPPDPFVLFDILLDHPLLPTTQQEELKKAINFILKRKFKE